MLLLHGDRFTHEACKQPTHSDTAVASRTNGRWRVNPRRLIINQDD